jgi:hypothetical protein
MSLNFDHLEHCTLTLERSLESLARAESGSINYEVFRNAVIKSFETDFQRDAKALQATLRQKHGEPDA